MSLAPLRNTIIGLVVGIEHAIEATFLFAIGGVVISIGLFYTYILGTVWIQHLTALHPLQNYVTLTMLTVCVAVIYAVGGWFILELRTSSGISDRIA